ncbi:MAG: glycosyltransferase family 4 protein, partial [Actinomycetota bacterium]|nr:glycosyltransferase family 4 protein [Actinomycetota bacterium]
MKVAIVKPDWRIRGGFEVVLGRIERDLTGAGHQVELVQVDVPSVPHRPFDLVVDSDTWARSPEWFSHLALLDTFRALDVSWADVVISTQPPSYGISHPRHLALFYHHARIFYDLEQVYIRAGFAPEILHRTAAALLRRSEAQDLSGVTHFLAGSERVRERLHQFQGDDVPLSLYQASAPPVGQDTRGAGEHVLCVSRHEFSKRTELAVLGLALAGDAVGVLAGSGGRLPFVRALAAHLAGGQDPESLTDADLWLNAGIPAPPRSGADGREHPRVRIPGRVADDELADLYRNALCVLAPAYDEDDGLTVAEAMSNGKPVIVCRDGGGLTSLVRHGENGLIVEPTGAAIAEAIRM